MRHVPAVALATGVSFFPSIDHDESNSESNLKLGFPKAAAYERRDVGDETRSAATAAMNEQAYKTNNRLEQSGFKLDTREEEKAKIPEIVNLFESTRFGKYVTNVKLGKSFGDMREIKWTR